MLFTNKIKQLSKNVKNLTLASIRRSFATFSRLTASSNLSEASESFLFLACLALLQIVKSYTNYTVL